MPADLVTYESLVSVTHGASAVLVAIGDPMWRPVALSGGQTVQSVALLRAAGILAQSRRNDRNTLTFELCVENTSVAAAVKALLLWQVSLPKTMADVTVKFADTTGVVLKNASIESWGGTLEEAWERRTLNIIGGELVTL